MNKNVFLICLSYLIFILGGKKIVYTQTFEVYLFYFLFDRLHHMTFTQNVM